MTVREALLERRSIRKFEETKLTEEQIRLLLEAAMAAPTGRNSQPWKFYVVTDEETLQKIRDGIGPHGNYPAPCAILVTGNENISNLWTSDCGAATENIMTQAVELGLGTLWLAEYPLEPRMESIRSIIHLEDGEIPFSLIYVGVPVVHPEPRTQYDEKKIVRI